MAIPPSLDHLILGASDLNRGVDFAEQRTGVRAAAGGAHPGRGTHNALLSLGQRCYLEILAPDPRQQRLTWFHTLPQLPQPRLLGWMIRAEDLSSVAERLRQAGVACEGPRESSRERPDGRKLRWKLTRVADDAGGLLPMLIEWSADSPHPADDAPKGCSLVQFEISSPEPEQLQGIFNLLGIDVPVLNADYPQLRARIAGPAGALELISGSVVKSVS
jgi:hypothetical protein